ncbi:MAG: hypothetical protein JO023_24505 [Chloroflexi bacterium]|nr:hypothetical protein [Chloroflexota bacterium]
MLAAGAAWRRGLPALCLAVALLATPVPGGASASTETSTVQDLGQERSGSAACGRFTVSWANAEPRTPGSTGQDTIRVVDTTTGTTSSITQAAAAPSETLQPLWCGDLLGDGSVALGYAHYSGGAHCCTTATVVTLGDPSRQLLQVELGNAGGLKPVQLGDGEPPQLLSESDVFAYFDDLSFVASPFLPLIFRYDGTQYVEATSANPEYLRGQLDQALAQLGTLPAQVPSRGGPGSAGVGLAQLEHESVALRAFGLYALLGDEQAGQASLERRLSPAVADWLSANAGDALAALQQRYALGR